MEGNDTVKVRSIRKPTTKLPTIDGILRKSRSLWLVDKLVRFYRTCPFRWKFCFWLVFASGCLYLLCILHILCQDPSSWLLSDSEDWIDFAQDYHKKFRRQPPKGLDAWMKYANRQQCQTRGPHYDALDIDMEFFRQQIQLTNKGLPLDLDQVIPLGKQLTNFFLAFSLENHKLTIVDYQADWTVVGQTVHSAYTKLLFRRLFEPIRQHTPPIKTKFIINLNDKPQVESVHATYPVLSFCKEDYYTDNKPIPPDILNNTHPTLIDDRAKHPKPAGFLASPDLLIPARSSLTMDQLGLWFWPFYSHGSPFHSRKNVIQWRGSTTGDWGTGPRFRLVRQFGGTGVHPLGDSGVVADFAFTNSVQKPKGAEANENIYRFTKYMKYKEMQDMKYIVDVDGNGKV
jgi:hypothetical protein